MFVTEIALKTLCWQVSDHMDILNQLIQFCRLTRVIADKKGPLNGCVCVNAMQ